VFRNLFEAVKKIAKTCPSYEVMFKDVLHMLITWECVGCVRTSFFLK